MQRYKFYSKYYYKKTEKMRFILPFIKNSVPLHPESPRQGMPRARFLLIIL